MEFQALERREARLCLIQEIRQGAIVNSFLLVLLGIHGKTRSHTTHPTAALTCDGQLKKHNPFSYLPVPCTPTSDVISYRSVPWRDLDHYGVGVGSTRSAVRDGERWTYWIILTPDLWKKEIVQLYKV
jgi:hypothetical protein